MAQIAWIIGGGSGIGAAVAQRLATAGWVVAISGRRADRLAALATGDPALRAYPLDVTDGAATIAVAARIVADLGRIDLMLFGAVAPVRMPVGRYDPESFRTAFDVNYLGFVRAADAVIPAMTAAGGGQLAVLASLAGYFGSPGAAVYASSKAALISLAQTMRTELAPSRIDVRLISPGFVRSELTAKNRRPMPMLLEADEAARRIVDGLTRSHRFEIAFPLPMALLMKLLRLLPYPLFFAAMRRALPRDRR